MLISNIMEFTQRAYDNKWICWELMDSKKIVQTSTWPRYKWVITGVWKDKPIKLMDKYQSKFVRREKNTSGRYVYRFEI